MIPGEGSCPSAQVIEGVIAQCMTFFSYHPEFFGMLSYIIPYKEKCGFRIIFVQGFQYQRGDFGNRTIVESEEDFFFCCFNFPGN